MKIGIAGGGASGMMAAIAAAKSAGSAEVFILEHKDTVGKKILSTGNGRCNLTNLDMGPSFYRGEDKEFISKVLSVFGSDDTLKFFHDLGVVTKARGAYIYPRCDQASSVLDMLKLELDRLGIKVYTNAHVSEIKKNKQGFQIHTSQGMHKAERVILSAGSKAQSVLGSDGSGYGLAKSLGHSLIPVVPALVQLKVKDHPFAKASGVRTDAKVTAVIDGCAVSEDTGELQITAYGISGIPVFQISRFIARGLYDRRGAQVSLDFFPEMGEGNFIEMLKNRAACLEDMTAGEYLTGIFHKKLVPVFLTLSGIRIQTPVKMWSEKDFRALAKSCKNTVLDIIDTNGFDNAQVCAGGINTKEINPETMESRYVDGLYITGELLDADGICGGYNLQWAWASGFIAGRAAARVSGGIK